jgi:hypothetical protein
VVVVGLAVFSVMAMLSNVLLFFFVPCLSLAVLLCFLTLPPSVLGSGRAWLS